jgi:chromosome segregation ATPase
MTMVMSEEHRRALREGLGPIVGEDVIEAWLDATEELKELLDDAEERCRQVERQRDDAERRYREADLARARYQRRCEELEVELADLMA